MIKTRTLVSEEKNVISASLEFRSVADTAKAYHQRVYFLVVVIWKGAHILVAPGVALS